jgi:glycosyltransferase involved in cell wall biosynthesis
LKEKLELALEKPNEMEEKVAKAYERLCGQYTWDEICGRYHRHYKKLIKV